MIKNRVPVVLQVLEQVERRAHLAGRDRHEAGPVRRLRSHDVDHVTYGLPVLIPLAKYLIGSRSALPSRSLSSAGFSSGCFTRLNPVTFFKHCWKPWWSRSPPAVLRPRCLCSSRPPSRISGSRSACGPSPFLGLDEPGRNRMYQAMAAVLIASSTGWSSVSGSSS